MKLLPPPTVERLQTALHTKAKEWPDYRFYALCTRCTAAMFWSEGTTQIDCSSKYTLIP